MSSIKAKKNKNNTKNYNKNILIYNNMYTINIPKQNHKKLHSFSVISSLSLFLYFFVFFTAFLVGTTAHTSFVTAVVVAVVVVAAGALVVVVVDLVVAGAAEVD